MKKEKSKCVDCNKSLDNCTCIEDTVDFKHQGKQLTKEEVMEQRSSKYEFMNLSRTPFRALLALA